MSDPPTTPETDEFYFNSPDNRAALQRGSLMQQGLGAEGAALTMLVLPVAAYLVGQSLLALGREHPLGIVLVCVLPLALPALAVLGARRIRARGTGASRLEMLIFDGQITDVDAQPGILRIAFVARNAEGQLIRGSQMLARQRWGRARALMPIPPRVGQRVKVHRTKRGYEIL